MNNEMNPKFSIVGIVRNEAKTLPRLMATLQDFIGRGGDVLLVDTGSTDGTAEVARKLGARVEEVGERFIITIDKQTADSINAKFVVGDDKPVINEGDRLFDFSSARNLAASLAKNDMVSFVDGDEGLTVLDIDRINALIDEGYEKFSYHFIFSHRPDGSEGISFTQSKSYDRRKMKWTNLIHEYLTGDGKGCYLDRKIYLLEHWQNPETDRSGYLRGLALDCWQHLDYDRNSHYFAREMYYTGRYRSAIKEFERHIEMKGWPAERAQSMVYIGDCLAALGDEAGAVKKWHEAYEVEPKRREALMRLAWHWYRKNAWQKAAAYANAALTIKRDDFYSNKTEHYTNEPHEILYVSLWWLGEREKSKEHYFKALGFCPYHQKYVADRVYYGYGDYTDVGIEGWMTAVELDFLHREAKKYKTVCELGSWKGRSTHALLSGCKGLVTAIDHFKGSDDIKDQTKRLGAIEDVYAAFMKNVGGFENLQVMRMSGAEADKSLSSDVKFDMVFIDAEHTYEGVKADIETWKKRAVRVLCGHDYCDAWPGVKKAVDEAFGKPDEVHGSIWVKRLSVEKPLVSIVIPTLGREDKLERCVKAAQENADWPIEVIVERDSFEDRQGCPKTLAKGVEKAKGDYICFLGNDCVPQKGFIAEAMKVMETLPEGEGLVSFYDKSHEGNLATHWVASKSLLPKLDGYFFHPDYEHTRCDNELTERCQMMGRYAYAPLARVDHDNELVKGNVVRSSYPDEHKSPKTELCLLAEKYRSDKCPSIFHAYTPRYDKLFKDRKDKVRSVLEIGIGTKPTMTHVKDYTVGASLLMWRDYFPNAIVYGLDTAPEAMFEGERIHTEICNQSVPEQLEKFAEGKEMFDIIIDDGSHNIVHQATSLKTLMKHLADDGIYVIEDIAEPERLLELIGSVEWNIELIDLNLAYSKWDRLLVARKHHGERLDDEILKIAYDPERVKRDIATYLRRKAVWGLQFTGERVVPDKMGVQPQTLAEHLARYEFAVPKVIGKVLDAPCGTGYGAEMMDADGCDVSDEALDYAKGKYPSRHFFKADLEKPDIGGKYDTVVSFEGLEHLDDPKPFIEWVRNTAKRFIFSIPVNNPSKWHKQVYSVDEIKALFSKFEDVEWYFQTGTEIRPLKDGDSPVFVVGVAKP